ncbi:hypothetical protein Pcinc_020677 [Petrolisthes cinctipes]|uniref:Uncharacterized protein n=1 Tax=Petrolisthes cinctipes TaxID=88211 RepID=A0AAE1FJT2_PETCI|nr:hypothetical protein Pcinc_020677 [Petrolisthes cinctipes]
MGKKTIYVLSGLKQGEGGYVSEGLAELLDEGEEVDIVVSSSALGPTWFSTPRSAHMIGGLRKARPLSSANAAAATASRVESSAHLDPKWVLSECGCSILTDFRYIRQAPVLTVLNGFELTMRSILLSASSRDSVVMAKNQVSKQELVVGRMRRCAALMCYSLIETLVWKSKMSESATIESIPSKDEVDYHALATAIKQRCDEFVQGEEEATEDNSRRYAEPSLTTFVSMVTKGIFSSFYSMPRIKGAFYESVLGVSRVMVHLRTIMSAEYYNLLQMVQEAEKKGILMPEHRLERIVENPSNDDESEDGLTEDELKWVALERNRRIHHRNSLEFGMEKAVPLGVSVRPTLKCNIGELDTRALSSLYRELQAEGFVESPYEAVKRVFSGRHVLHSNFDVSFNPFFSFYTLWNWLFLSTGALFNSPSNPVTRDILVNVITKDMHALLVCPRCYEGFVTKHKDTCKLVEYTKQGLARLRMDLQDVMYAFTLKDSEETDENELFKSVLLYNNAGLNISQTDEIINKMSTSAKKTYAIRAISASRGFAAIGIYSLLSSMKLDNLPASDIQGVDLLNRWSLSEDVLYAISFGGGSGGPSTVKDRDMTTMAFIGLWALRNAVRLRRDVHDRTNYTDSSLPSSPMTLSSALLQTSRFNNERFLNLPYVTNFKQEFVNVVEKFKEDLITL